jgi:hypothetical protein
VNSIEGTQPLTNRTGGGELAGPVSSGPRAGGGKALYLQACSCGGQAGEPGEAQSAEAASYVFAIGRIEPRFPSLGVEKEFAQATGHADTTGLTDRQALQRVLAERPNRYLMRQLCWVLTIEGIETYILQPRDSNDFDLLLDALRPEPKRTDIDVVIGIRGPVAPSEMCNGLMVPIVFFDQIYSFDPDELVNSIPRPEQMDADAFSPAARELFERIMSLADNAGATDEHRALNYLAVRYPAVYAQTAQMFGRNSSLTGVEVRPSRLSGTRNVVAVIFTYTDRQTDVSEKYFVRVDVTEEFPFLVSKFAPFFER